MRVVMLSPNPGQQQVRVRKQATSLNAAGHAVTVLSLRPREDGEPDELVVEGVRYWSVPPPSRFFATSRRSVRGGARTTIVARLLGQIPVRLRIKYWGGAVVARLNERRIVRMAVELAPQVVHHRDLHTMRAASRIARRCGALVVSDFPELPGYQTDRTSKVAARRERAATRAMQRHYPNSVLRFTVSPGIADFLAEHFGHERPYVLLNSPRVAAQRPASSSLRDDCSIGSDTPLLAFVGDVATGRGVEALLEALLGIDGLHLAVVGASPRRAQKYGFEEKVRHTGMEGRVHVLPAQPAETLLEYLGEATVGAYLLEDTCLNHRWAAPNKFFEMLLAGLPLVVSDLSVMGEIVRRHGLGFAVPDGDPDRATAAIRAVVAQPDRYRPAAATLDELRDLYGWEAQARILVDAYGRLGSDQGTCQPGSGGRGGTSG